VCVRVELTGWVLVFRRAHDGAKAVKEWLNEKKS